MDGAVPRLVGLLTLLVALMDIGSGITPALRTRLHGLAALVPGSVNSAAGAATIVAGVLFLLLARALRRRKRRAWQAAVLLLAVSVLLHLVKGHDLIPAGISLLLLGALLALRRDFYALGDPRTRWRALGVFLVLTASSLALGAVLVWLPPGRVLGSPSAALLLQEVVLGLVGAKGSIVFGNDRYSDLVYFFLLGMGVVTALVTAYLVLRPAEPEGRLTPTDDDRLRELLARYGDQDSLGYFALRRDKSVTWSATGKAAIAYRVVSGVMLAAGDPVGDPEAWPGAIAQFLEEADRHAWVPAVIGCSETGGEIWCRESGMSALELGDEAIVDVADFSLEGRAMRNVRQMVARVTRAGYTSAVRRVRDIPVDERELVARRADEWRDGVSERGFSMALGRFGEEADGDCVVATAQLDGKIRALLHFVPWGVHGLSLDLMRRDRAADPGLNEM
ncbi:MAG: phosphatidylglycerol lysyltransferase domain-containing protein, partial [Actinomycetes bacterium]